MKSILRFLDDLKLYGLIAGIHLSRFIPDAVLDTFMTVAACIWYATDSYRKRAVENNLRIVLGEDFDRKLVCRTFINYMRNFTDVLKVKHRSCEDILRKVKLDGLDKIEPLRGQGFIFLTGHIGNWELGASVPACVGFRAIAIVENIDPRWLKVLNSIRSHTGMELVTLGKATPAIVKALKEGKVVMVATDRYVGGGKYELVPFFGKRRKMPVGIFHLNEKLKKPMAFGYVVRDGKSYRAVVQDVYYGPYRTKEMLDFYVKNMEEAIRRYPDQWFSFDFGWVEAEERV